MNWKYSLAAGLIAGLPLLAGPAGPPQPGTVSYVEGEVQIANRPISSAREQAVGPNQRLTTKNGRAELLLVPGTYLRVDRRSAIRLEEASLSDVRLIVEHGAAIVNVIGKMRDADVEAVVGATTVRFSRKGIYRVDAEDHSVAVYEGEAHIYGQGPSLSATKNRKLVLAGTPKVVKIKGRPEDDFDHWSRVREKHLASMRSLAYARLYPGWYYDPFWGPYPYWWGPGYIGLWGGWRWR